jgi:DNA-binding response OmpR family regulator
MKPPSRTSSAHIWRAPVFTVHTVDRGDEALEAARLVNPDLVVLDLMLPGMDGMEVTARLRESRMSTS